MVAQPGSEVLHGIRFQVAMERRRAHSRAYRRLRLRQSIRRGLMGLIGLVCIAVAVFAANWLVEGLRVYDPKYYEPKDLELQAYEKEPTRTGQR